MCYLGWCVGWCVGFGWCYVVYVGWCLVCVNVCSVFVLVGVMCICRLVFGFC